MTPTPNTPPRCPPKQPNPQGPFPPSVPKVTAPTKLRGPPQPPKPICYYAPQRGFKLPPAGRPYRAHPPHPVARLLGVVDPRGGDGVRGEAVSQPGQQHAIAQVLLQLRGGGQLLTQAGLHPAGGGGHRRVALSSTPPPSHPHLCSWGRSAPPPTSPLLQPSLIPGPYLSCDVGPPTPPRWGCFGAGGVPASPLGLLQAAQVLVGDVLPPLLVHLLRAGPLPCSGDPHVNPPMSSPPRVPRGGGGGTEV